MYKSIEINTVLTLCSFLMGLETNSFVSFILSTKLNGTYGNISTLKNSFLASCSSIGAIGNY